MFLWSLEVEIIGFDIVKNHIWRYRFWDTAIAAILDQLVGTLPELCSPTKSWITDDHWDVKPVGDTIIVLHRSIPIVVENFPSFAWWYPNVVKCVVDV